MKKYLVYLGYILKHKYFVLVECFKIGLFWRGITHDMSKFRPSEFFPYVDFFYKKQPLRDKSGYFKPTDTGDLAFDFAWLLHQKRNDHHWQWWCVPNEGNKLRAFKMSKDALNEMVCDWIGAGKAQGRNISTLDYYEINKHKIILHPETKKELIEKLKKEKKRGR